MNKFKGEMAFSKSKRALESELANYSKLQKVSAIFK